MQKTQFLLFHFAIFQLWCKHYQTVIVQAVGQILQLGLWHADFHALGFMLLIFIKRTAYWAARWWMLHSSFFSSGIQKKTTTASVHYFHGYTSRETRKNNTSGHSILPHTDPWILVLKLKSMSSFKKYFKSIVCLSWKKVLKLHNYTKLFYLQPYESISVSVIKTVLR